VKQSGGRLEIHSAQGQGTTVEITLPLVQAAGKTDTAQPPRATLPSPPVADRRRRRILIVDDEPALAKLVQVWATAQGYTTVMAGSADDAIALLSVRAFDVLLTDIVMPGSMDGIGLAEVARALHPAMKILLMSGYSRETATNLADVPWPLLVKPFQREDFDAALA
jgi:DNA-binding NtrC family response regulator